MQSAHSVARQELGVICSVEDANYLQTSGQLKYTQARRLVFSGPGEEIAIPLHLLLDAELLAAAVTAATAGGANLQSRLGLAIRLKTSQAVFTFDVASRSSEQAGHLVSLLMAERRKLPGSLPQLVETLDPTTAAESATVACGLLYKFNLEAEFIRIGAVNNPKWRLWRANEDYSVCDTYPRLLYVPANVPDQVLLECAKFRSRGRLPALSYLHESTQAALCRCSQPLVGLSARSSSDEQVVQAISDANPNSEAGRPLHVVDTRPRVNAIGNRAMGKGYESADNYRNTEVSFCQIENIHVMRDSQKALALACQLGGGGGGSGGAHAWSSRVNKSGWLKHIRAILLAAQFVADKLTEGASVLVHCSDGWDRTAQTSALAQLLIDPHYRTLHGFQDLIEKEWLSFGHKFSDRCAHYGWSDEASPVFGQFADCVHQLQRLFPTRFEFNEAYLLALVDAAYSCQFATFLGNCERERRAVEAELRARLPCFWTHALERRGQFVNPLYCPDSPTRAEPLQLGAMPRSLLRVWFGLQNPWWRSRRAAADPDEATLIRRLALSAERLACLADHERWLARHSQLSGEPGPQRLCTGRWELAAGGRDACPACERPWYQYDRIGNCHACGRLACARCLVPGGPLAGQTRGQLALLCPVCCGGSSGLAGGAAAAGEA